MTKLTAVEFLWEEVAMLLISKDEEYALNVINKAKQMEKEQIEKSIDDALNAYGIIINK